MKLNKIVLIFLFSVFFAIIVLMLLSRDHVVLERRINNSCSFRVMAHNEWEISIPFYLVVKWQNKTIKSGSFYYCPPEEFQAKTFEFNTVVLDSLAYIYDINDQASMFALIDCEHEIVFPPYGEVSKEYHDLTQKCLNRLTILMNNNDLKLVR